MEKVNRTLMRALDMLQLLKDTGMPMTVREISLAMNMPTSSAFEIVRTLFVAGYLEESAGERKKAYVLGAKLFEIGAAYLNNTDLSRIARPYVERLMKLTNATAFLAVVSGHQVVYLDKMEAPTAVRTTAELGSRREMYATGLGKAVLSLYTEEKVRRVFAESKVEAHTEHTITNLDELLADLRKARERGYAIDDREGNVDVYCIACAIRNNYGKPIAAISIAMMYSMVNEETTVKYGEAIIAAARDISYRLGYVEH